MIADTEGTLLWVVGYKRCTRYPQLRCQHIGFVQEPTREGGYYLAMAVGYGRFQPECVGGATRPELAAEILREKASFPSVRHCPWDGKCERF